MKDSGIDSRDELWLARQLKNPAPDDDGVCFATWGFESTNTVLGPFACKADAEAAHQGKLDELTAQGIDLTTADIRMGVVFGDPTVYHVPPKDTVNG